MSDERSEVAQRIGMTTPRGLWALGFVVLSLAALVAVPWFFERRVADKQDRITRVLEPAARLSSNLQQLKARQLARMEGYLATEDPAFRIPYYAAIATEDSIMSELRVLARDLDDDVFERVARLTSVSIDWRLVNQQIFDRQFDGFGIEPGQREQVVEGYEDLLSATDGLATAIRAEVLREQDAMDRERARWTAVTVPLVIFALLSTAIVARVGYRYRDISFEAERRRREAVRARREIDALLEATGDGVLGVDLSGTVISLNRAGAQLLGYTEREITGRDVHDTLFHTLPSGEPNPREASLIIQAIERGEMLESEDGAVLWRRRGIPFPARWSLRPMVDGTELRGAVLTFTDMTEVSEKEEALRRAVKQREDVVSIVSHDLRNPLGVALASADLLLDLPLDEAQRRRQAQIIRRSGERMRRLIEDLLDVARIEAGALVVRPSLESLAPILDEAADLYTDQASARALTLTVDPASGGQARVDRDRIMQALSNLLDNAVRLTPEGGSVTLSAAQVGEQVEISVADTGPGIEPDQVERLFDRFAQGHGRDSGAAGLGLTIVQGVAVAHAGRVVVDSVPGRGSTFTLLLPRRGPPAGEG